MKRLQQSLQNMRQRSSTLKQQQPAPKQPSWFQPISSGNTTQPKGQHFRTPDGKSYFREDGGTWYSAPTKPQIEELTRVYGAPKAHPNFNLNRVQGQIPDRFGMGGIRQLQPDQNYRPDYFTNPDEQRANDLVNMELNPQENQLKRNLELLQLLTQQQVNTQQNFAQFGDQRLQEIYSALNKDLNKGVDRVKGIYDGAQGQIAGGYDAAGQAITEASQGIQGHIQGQAQHLGLEEALTDPMQQLAGQLAKLQAQNASAKAGAVGGAVGLGADMQAIGVQGVMDSQREGVGARTNLLSDVQRAIAEAMNQGSMEAYGTLGQLGDLQQNRGIKLREALREVTEARTDRERQSKLDALEEELARSSMRLNERQFGLQESQFDFERQRWGKEFGLAEQEFGLNKQVSLANLAIAREQLSMQQRELQAQMAAATSPYNQAMAEAELRKIEAEINKLDAQAMKSQAEAMGLADPKAKKYKGQSGVEAWARDTNMPWVSGAVKELLNDATLISAGDIASQYETAMALVPQYIKVPYSPDVLRTAINVFFGKY